MRSILENFSTEKLILHKPSGSTCEVEGMIESSGIQSDENPTLGSGTINTYNYMLETIKVSEDNKYFSSKNGVLYNKTGTRLIRCPIGKKGEYSIDNNTKKIETSAFEYCKELENIILSNKLKEIGASAFSGAKSLREW